METAVAITDRMKYGVKPSAVRSENYLHNIKASNGYYCDFSTCYFRVKVDISLGTTITQAAGATVKNGNGYVRFERGPESMFRRVLIQDASGNLLESFENYNDLYCLTELLTDSKQNREGFSTFHGEGLKVPGNTVPTVVGAGAVSQLECCVDVSPFATNATAGGAIPKINGKYPPLFFPSLGGAVIANYAVGNGGSTDLVNPTQYKFGSYSLFDQDYSAQSSTGGYTLGQKGGKYYTFQLISSLFGGCAEKYLPMSAINGMRIILSCLNVKGAFVTNGLYYNAAGDTANSISRVIISDPTFFMNMVRVDPIVDAQLIKSAQSPEDGNIRIHSQTYQTFQMSILANQATFEYVIPIKVSSLKAIYFTFSPQDWTPVEIFDQTDNVCSSFQECLEWKQSDENYLVLQQLS